MLISNMRSDEHRYRFQAFITHGKETCIRYDFPSTSDMSCEWICFFNIIHITDAFIIYFSRVFAIKREVTSVKGFRYSIEYAPFQRFAAGFIRSFGCAITILINLRLLLIEREAGWTVRFTIILSLLNQKYLLLRCETIIKRDRADEQKIKEDRDRVDL